MPIRYGRSIKVTTDGTISQVHEQKFVNFQAMSNLTYICERFPIESKQDALTMFLRLHERWMKGEIKEPGCEVKEKNGKPQFIDLMWAE